MASAAALSTAARACPASRASPAWRASPHHHPRAPARSLSALGASCSGGSSSIGGSSSRSSGGDGGSSAPAPSSAFESAESTWRASGALDGSTPESVERTVRGTLAVARHYARLIEQQAFHAGKYGEGDVLPASHADPAWVASRLALVSRMTGVAPEHLPDMVEQAGAGVLALDAPRVLEIVLALKALAPDADASHMLRVEPDLLLVEDVLGEITYGGAAQMDALRALPLPEPCVRLLVCEEPGLLLGKGGLVRMDQLRDQANEHAANVAAACEGLGEEDALDVNAQRWFTNVFCGYQYY